MGGVSNPEARIPLLVGASVLLGVFLFGYFCVFLRISHARDFPIKITQVATYLFSLRSNSTSESTVFMPYGMYRGWGK